MESDTCRSSGQVLSEALLASTAVISEDEVKGEHQDVNCRRNNPDHASGLPSTGLISAVSTGSAAALSTRAGPRQGDPNPHDFLADGSNPDMAVRVGLCKSFKGGRRSTSVTTLLRQLAAGNTLRGEAWKLTRAVVHVEDAWKGRISPCPPLEEKGLRRLFKLRWKYRGVDFWLIHLLLVLCLLEVPAWCIQDRQCFWECYPDFTRDWHMEIWMSLVLEGTMLTALVLMALVDVHVCGSDYWKGAKGVSYQSTWFKHGILAVYGTIFALAVIVDFRAHALCDYLRVLLYLSVHRRTMVVVTQIRHILGAVAEIWLLIFLNIVLFSWVGTVLFKDTDEGDYEFPDVFEACWRLFVLFTTTNFPDIMMTALDSVRATVIYFVGFVLLNAFFLAQLSLAFIFNVFRGGQKGIPRMEEEIRLNRSAAAFSLLDDRGVGRVTLANMGALLLEVHGMRGLACREVARLLDLMEEASVRRPEEPSLDLNDFQDAVRVMDRSLRHAEWITEIQWYYPRLHQSAPFRRLTRVVKYKRLTLWRGGWGLPHISMLLMDWVDAALLISSFVTMFVANGVIDTNGIMEYDWVQISVVFGFGVTTSLCAVVRGWHNCVQRPAWVFNVAMTIPSLFVVFVAFGSSSTATKWGWRVMRALRIAHLSLGIAFVPRLGFLVRTLSIMTRRASTPASVLLVWALFMAVLGTQIFGGMVCVPDFETEDETCGTTIVANNVYTKEGLYLLNFNDVPTSLLTLFVLFVVNEWYVIADEFVEVSGTGWARAFFIVNYIMGVAVILNLMVTVVINSFWDEYKLTNRPALALRLLHNAAAASARHDATTSDPPPRDDAAEDVGENSTVDLSGDTDHRLSPSRFLGLADNIWGWPSSHRRSGGEARVAAEEEAGLRNTEAIVPALGSTSTRSSPHELFPTQPPLPHVMPDGDQEGMAAERAIAKRASRRRLDISGIT